MKTYEIPEEDLLRLLEACCYMNSCDDPETKTECLCKKALEKDTRDVR